MVDLPCRQQLSENLALGFARGNVKVRNLIAEITGSW